MTVVLEVWDTRRKTQAWNYRKLPGKEERSSQKSIEKRMVLSSEMSLPELSKGRWMFLTWWVFINCLLGSFAPLKVFLICRAEERRGCSHPCSESSHSPRASVFSKECLKWCHCGGCYLEGTGLLKDYIFGRTCPCSLEEIICLGYF